ncbi:MAG TPA: TonB-dependent receptor [Steroidobacteraceae bacterium]
MKTHEGKFLSMLVTCLLGIAVAMPVSAQDQLETIVVTARKRDEAILDVPVAISAYSAQEVESAGILRPQDFIALTPNMTMVQTQNQGTSFIVVRGISQARNSEPSVAVLIDGVLMANPSQFNQELFDIASIEVLKGPQGALYGRNAIGGAVIITTREPGDELEGMLTAGYDSGPGYRARFSVGGPMGGSDAWKFQLSGSYLDTDGYIDNPFLGEEADPFQDLSGRLKLIYEPSDRFRADFRVSLSQVDTQALYFNIVEQADDTSLPVRVNNRGENERDMMSASLKLDFALGGGTLTSITAYDTLEELLTGDQFNFLPIPESVLIQFGADQAQHQWLDVEAVSQEIRYTSPAENRVRWIAGAYAIATDRFISTGNVFDDGSGIVPRVTTEPLPFFAPQFSYLADSQDNLAWAVFGEVSFDITDRVEGSIALRYDEDERENTTETPQVFIPDAIACDTIPTPPVCANTGDVRTETWDELQPKVTLRFKPNNQVTTYASYSRGFRSGGFNQTGVGSAPNPFGVLNGINDLFDEETADTFELGVKARLNDGRVTVGASAYHTEAEGSYFFVFDPTTSTQNLGNLDKVEYQGLEAEVQAQLTDNFEVYLRGGLTDSEIKESARAATDVGNQAPLVSEYTINLGAMWRAPLGGGGLELFIRPDFQVIGDTWWWPDNFTKRSPVELLNLRAGVQTENWSVIAWSRNLTDEEYNAEWSPGPQFFPNPGYTNNFVFKAQPRVWGVDFTYRF